ncbi:MAG: energy-coupling factor ABC transporter permease, partial [Methanocorpusculum sp.]|nr:energy-coupling factor ABC transporter permease [Methanocorpusculum sp.]
MLQLSALLHIAAFTRLARRRPEALPLLGLAGAFVFILSSLKIPSVGSSSHLTGTGFGSVLFGPAITSVFCTIVLVFHALFLATGVLRSSAQMLLRWVLQARLR